MTSLQDSFDMEMVPLNDVEANKSSPSRLVSRSSSSIAPTSSPSIEPTLSSALPLKKQLAMTLKSIIYQLQSSPSRWLATCSLCYSFVAWHVVKSALIWMFTASVLKKASMPPYQVVGNDGLVLDFVLNQPLVMDVYVPGKLQCL
jgi:hypothetical protein